MEPMDASGRRLAKARLPEGVAGIARLHAMVAERFGECAEHETEVVGGIETDRGLGAVRAPVAAGCTVSAVNPLVAARSRERRAVSGAKTDAADAHMLADMVRAARHVWHGEWPHGVVNDGSRRPGYGASRGGPIPERR